MTTNLDRMRQKIDIDECGVETQSSWSRRMGDERIKLERLAELGRWAEQYAIPALQESSTHSFYCIFNGTPTSELGECDACDALTGLRKIAEKAGK